METRQFNVAVDQYLLNKAAELVPTGGSNRGLLIVTPQDLVLATRPGQGELPWSVCHVPLGRQDGKQASIDELDQEGFAQLTADPSTSAVWVDVHEILVATHERYGTEPANVAFDGTNLLIKGKTCSATSLTEYPL